MKKPKKPMQLHVLLVKLRTDLLIEPLDDGRWKCTFEADVTEARDGKIGVQTPYGIGKTFTASLESFCTHLRGKQYFRRSSGCGADIIVDVPLDLTV